MTAFLLAWGLFQSIDFACCISCLPRLGYVCKEIPTSYPADMSTLVLWVSDVGEINSTVFNHTNLASVSSLTLEKSGITSIAPRAFDKFQTLKTLNLYSNDLSLVTSAWFTHKNTLESLNLSSNSIAALNIDSFLGLVGLLRLNLSHNQIQSISSGTFHSLSNLIQLDLSNNRLSHISVDMLSSLNSTKLLLNGNPWNCSYTEFAIYLREFQRASLLENEMEVLCNSPACLKGVPVWNVSKCVETIITVDPTYGSNSTSPSASVKPHVNWSIIISLIVVLCALVLVICVLSVLYHRKQEQKHLQTIKPSSEDPQSGNRAQSDCREQVQSSKNEEFVPGKKKKQLCNGTEVVVVLDQTLLDSEKVSQIYQIYGTGIHQIRETSSRAKSAGPVLSKTGLFGRRPETEVVVRKDPRVVKGEELYDRWAEAKEERENVGDCSEELFDGAKDTSKDQEDCSFSAVHLHQFHRVQNEHLQAEKADHGGDGFKTPLEEQGKFKENPDMEGGEKEEYMLEDNSTKKQLFLHTDYNDPVCNVEEFEDNLTSSLARHSPSQQSNDDQPFQDSEIMPYLTIGTDPENQNSEPEPISTEASTRQVPSKPIRRVLTWPPTAAQWKKQWVQTEQVLNVFPKVIFVTECKHQINTFPSTVPSPDPKHFQQKDVSDFKTVQPLKKICEAAIHTFIQNFPSSAQDYSELNEAHARIIDVSNSPMSSKAHSGNSSPLPKERHSKSDNEESVSSSEDSENLKRSNRGRKMDHPPKSEQVVAKSKRQSRRRERERRKPVRGNRDQSGSGSRAPPSGGSPSDDNLLVDNEYAFIDLLHEVAENHGRWTRERWRQSHMNKQKHKQPGKGH